MVRIHWNSSGIVNHWRNKSVFIFKSWQQNTLQSSFSVPLPPPNPQFLCFSLPREKGWEPSEVLSIQQRHELKRQIHRGLPACRDKGRPRRKDCESTRDRFAEGEKKQIWLKKKPGHIKVQAELRCPNKVQWSSVNWDALIFLFL